MFLPRRLRGSRVQSLRDAYGASGSSVDAPNAALSSEGFDPDAVDRP
jgi:hypothetical protein